jgi:hypothetical protein
MGEFSVGNTVDVKFGGMTVPGGEIESFLTKTVKGIETPYVRFTNGAEIPLEQISKPVATTTFVPKAAKQRAVAQTPKEAPKTDEKILSKIGQSLKEKVEGKAPEAPPKETPTPETTPITPEEAAQTRAQELSEAKKEAWALEKPKTKKESRRKEAYKIEKGEGQPPKAEGTMKDWYMYALEHDKSFARSIGAMEELPKSEKEFFDVLKNFYANVATGALSVRTPPGMKSALRKFRSSLE